MICLAVLAIIALLLVGLVLAALTEPPPTPKERAAADVRAHRVQRSLGTAVLKAELRSNAIRVRRELDDELRRLS